MWSEIFAIYELIKRPNLAKHFYIESQVFVLRLASAKAIWQVHYSVAAAVRRVVAACAFLSRAEFRHVG